jgi:septum site-determining protein MinD
VIPGSLKVNSLKPDDMAALPEVTMNLLGRADFILVDCAAGLGREALVAIKAGDEIVVVTNPDLPSVTNALKTVKVAKKLGKRIIGVVVNRVNGSKHELGREQIEEMLRVPVLGEIPEDRNVPKSIDEKKPLVIRNPDSPAAKEITRIARILTGKEGYEMPSLGFFGRIVRWIIG